MLLISLLSPSLSSSLVDMDLIDSLSSSSISIAGADSSFKCLCMYRAVCPCRSLLINSEASLIGGIALIDGLDGDDNDGEDEGMLLTLETFPLLVVLDGGGPGVD